MIYFVQAGADGLIKIGKAHNPERRIRTLQVGCPFQLHTLLICKGDYEEEIDIHLRFAEFRAHGEWFHPHETLLLFIRDRARPRGSNTIPDAKAYLVRCATIYQWVIQDCPFCHCKHRHGGGPIDGNPMEYLGHRTPHCAEGTFCSDYILKEA